MHDMYQGGPPCERCDVWCLLLRAGSTRIYMLRNKLLRRTVALMAFLWFEMERERKMQHTHTPSSGPDLTGTERVYGPRNARCFIAFRLNF